MSKDYDRERRRKLGRDQGSVFEKFDDTQESQAVGDAIYGGDSNAKVMRSLRPHIDGSMTFGAIRLTSIGIQWPENRPVTQDMYEDLGRILFRLDGSVQWLIGDWLNFGDNHKWGETIRQIADEFGKEIATIYDYKYVSDNVKVSVRTETLSFTHHKLVAALPPSDQLRLIKLAAYGDPVIGKEGNPALNEDGTPKRKTWSVSRLRKEIQGDQPKALPSFDDKLVSFIDRWIKDSDPRTVVDKLRTMADEIEAKL